MNKIERAVLNTIEYPYVETKEFIHHMVQAEKVLATTIKNTPELKAELLTLISKSTVLASLIASDVASKGLNIANDLTTLQTIVDTAKYITETFLPTVEAIYKELKDDVK